MKRGNRVFWHEPVREDSRKLPAPCKLLKPNKRRSVRKTSREAGRCLRVAKARSARFKKPPEQEAWRDMKRRCHDPRNKDYGRYGGRGIVVCEAWRESYKQFLADVGPKPEPNDKYSLGRKDNDGNYEPGNVRWELRGEQMNNKSSSRRITVAGVEMTLTQAARKCGITREGLRKRLRAMSPEQAMQRPARRHRQPTGVITTPKLTPADVAEIRRLFAAGHQKKGIGEKFGVSGSTVRRIVNGQAWRNVASA